MRRPVWLLLTGVVVVLVAYFFTTPALQWLLAPKEWKYAWRPPALVEAHVYVIPWSVVFSTAPTPATVLAQGDRRMTLRGEAAKQVVTMIRQSLAAPRPVSHLGEVRWGIVITRDGARGEGIFISPLDRTMRANQRNYAASEAVLQFMRRFAPLLDPTMPADLLNRAEPAAPDQRP